MATKLVAENSMNELPYSMESWGHVVEDVPECAILARTCSERGGESPREVTKALPTLAEDRTLWSKLDTASEATRVRCDSIRTQAQK